MKKLIYLVSLLLFLVSPGFSQALTKYQDQVTQGNLQVTTGGVGSTNRALASYPSSTVTVYLTGTTTLATIYSDALFTPKSNPFTATSLGYFEFYITPGTYDIRFSGTGIATPFTRSALEIGLAKAIQMEYYATASRPTCSLSARGRMIQLTDGNKAVQTCKNTAGSTYSWVDEHAGEFNIHDFGASPQASGAINTPAIQAAFTAAAAAGLSYQTAAGLYAGANAPVVFPIPNAVYETNATIDLAGAYVQVRGNNSVLKKASSFTGTYALRKTASAWQMSIRDLQFDGYDGGIDLDSSNLDVGLIQIENCSFYGITVADAIHLDAQSSITVIERCRFSTVKHALYVETGDKVIFRDNWIFPSIFAANYDATIINYGTALHIQGGVFVPSVQTVVEPAWVNNFGSVYIENVRFGGESGAMPAVNNYTVADTTYPQNINGVHIRASPNYSNNPAGTPMVRLFEVPNTVILENNFGLLEVPMISWSASISGGSQTSKIAAAASTLFLRVEGNFYSAATPSVPSNLQPYLMQPIGGTGVTVTPDTTGRGMPTISIGQAVATTSNPTFNNLILNGTLTASGITKLLSTTGLTWSSGNPTAIAGFEQGTSGTGGSAWFHTPGLNSTFSSGFGISGVYSSQISTITLGAYGTASVGGYGSRLNIATTKNGTITNALTIDEDQKIAATSSFSIGSTGTATATAGAATSNTQTGTITSESLTTASGASYTLTLTNSFISSSSKVFTSFANGTNTQGTLAQGEVTPGSGSATIVIRNIHASQALNGTIKISFLVF